MNKPRRILITAGIAGSVLGPMLGGVFGAAPAYAQEAADNPAFDGSTIIEAIDEATLRATLDAIGVSSSPMAEDKTVLRIEYPQGGRAILRLTACTDGFCKGLLMLGYFSQPEGKTADQIAPIAQRFSLNYNPASVLINDAGEHIVKSYLILDGGVTKANLAIQLSLFGSSVRSYAKELYEAN